MEDAPNTAPYVKTEVGLSEIRATDGGGTQKKDMWKKTWRCEVDGWRVVAGALDRVARHAAEPSHPPLPVYLLELGWTRKAGCTVRPWSYERVEVLKSVGEVPEGGTPPLSCVHWGSQPEDAAERERAMEALLTVVREGSFPTLRGFSLWKITTNAQHREVEPFAIVLPPPRAAGEEPVKSDADTRMLDAAASLGRLLSRPPR